MKKRKKILFFDAKPYDQCFFDKANRQKYQFKINYFQGHLKPNTASLSKGHDAVCAFVNDTLSKEVLDILFENKIEIVALRSAGYNNVDLAAAYGRVHVVRVPGYSPHAVAEHAAALILSLNRKIHKAYVRVREGNFSIDRLLGFDLYGKTAGIIGTGQIGRCMIDILKGFGMKVFAYDPNPDNQYAKEAGCSYVDLDTLYAKSDIISLHCPLTPQTYHLINSKSIARMKKGVMIINTGRGGLIYTKDLIEGLKGGDIGSAGLDVYEEESEYFFEDFSASMISDDVLARLLTFPNVLVTSHQGFFTEEALTNIAETTLGNLKDFFQGGYLKNEVCYRCDKDCRKKKQKRCF